MYKPGKRVISKIKRQEILEGETIEQKIERIVLNKEPIKDGAPEIYTERKEGVLSAYNIRTDRWEIACEAMHVGEMSKIAKRDAKAEKKPTEDIAPEVKKSDEPKS